MLGLISRFDSVLGILLSEKETPTEEVLSLLEERKVARSNKDWGASDRIRDEVQMLGWVIKDTSEGQKLTRS